MGGVEKTAKFPIRFGCRGRVSSRIVRELVEDEESINCESDLSYVF